MVERNAISVLLHRLDARPKIAFPKTGEQLDAPSAHGVYVIRDRRNAVVHVGRTVRGQSGLLQRLRNHLHGQSSFVNKFLDGQAHLLREGYSYQYLEVEVDRKRALLEHIATAWYCPKHLGLGR